MLKRKNKIFISLQKSFTLIEVLVVIAIIGILAGMILVYLGETRKKAKDSRIIAEMGQLRNAADLYYNNNNNSYSSLDCSITDPNIDALCIDISSQGGTKPSDDSAGIDIFAGYAGYCAKVKLNSGKYWCIDSIGKSKLYTADPGDCPGVNLTCD